MRQTYIAAISTILMLAAPAAAEPLTSDDIRSDIIGRTVFLAVPMGGEFPLNYRTSGRVDGSGEAVGLGRLTKPKDSGTWWIKGDRLCQKFKTWYDGAPMCFKLESAGPNKVKWTRDNGETGVARIAN